MKEEYRTVSNYYEWRCATIERERQKAEHAYWMMMGILALMSVVSIVILSVMTF